LQQLREACAVISRQHRARTVFFNMAMIQDQNIVGTLHGLEPVRDNDRGPVVQQFVDRPFD
jgi:hypothetical protein